MKIIEDWKDSWKYYSTWFMVLLFGFPELYQAAVSFGLVNESIPDEVTTAFRVLAGVGLVARFIKQSKPKLKAK